MTDFEVIQAGQAMREYLDEILCEDRMGWFLNGMQYVCMICGMSADIPPRIEHKVDCMQLKISRVIAAWDQANRSSGSRQ